MDARHFAVAGALSFGAFLVHAQNDSLAGFRAPLPVQAQPAAAVPADSAPPQVASPGVRDASEVPRALPGRVLLVMAHGSVVVDGAGLVFKFDHAPLPEVIAAIGRGFGVGLAYSGPTGRSVTGQWRCEGPEEALCFLVDRTNLRFSFEGGIWSVGELAAEAPPTIDFSQVIKNGEAPPAADSAASQLPAKPGRSK